MSEQRKAYSAGLMKGKRVERLEALGMVWDPLDAAWEENLTAAREYHAHHGTLTAPPTATALDKPVGQWPSNQRRPGALTNRPDRIEALAEIDPNWNPTWPLDWQRHYAAVRECLTGGAQPADLLPWRRSTATTSAGGWNASASTSSGRASWTDSRGAWPHSASSRWQPRPRRRRARQRRRPAGR
ncbi:helicase associated domain-containing protein [Kitasatospora sp. NPDC001159]